MLRKTALTVTAAFILILVIGLTFSPGAAQEDVLDEVKTLLRMQYVEPLPEEKLEGETIQEVLDNIDDPYTDHLTREEYRDYLDSIDNDFSGIGVYFEMVEEGVMVTSVMPDTPAEEAGVKAGDIIVEAAGESLEGASNEKAVRLITGPEGTEVELKIQREDREGLIELVVTRSQIEVPSVMGELLGEDIGYLELLSFGEQTPQKFEEHYLDLKEQGADKWVVDVRYNSGGYLHAALEIAGYFLNGDPATRVKNYNLDIEDTLEAEPADYSVEGPVIMLTNEYSASASEILAAALKDHGEGFLVGETTFGKGSVQSPYRLSDDSYLIMTVNYFYSPDGTTINEVGVDPQLDLQGMEGEEFLQAAELLLSGKEREADTTRLGYDDNWEFDICLEAAREPENWPVFHRLVEEMGVEESRDYFYPEHRLIKEMENIEKDHRFAITFSHPVDRDTVDRESIRLVNQTEGESIDLSFEFSEDKKEVKVITGEEMTPGEDYWLLIEQEITGKKGERLSQPGLVEVPVE